MIRVLDIPEFKELIGRYGVSSWDDEPTYVIYGFVNTPLAGRKAGLLSFASNEFHAAILQREFGKYGLVRFEPTKFNQSSSKNVFFDVEMYCNKLSIF